MARRPRQVRHLSRDDYEKGRSSLFARQGAYQRVFAKSQDTRAVLEDLARFCRAHESTADENSHVAARLDGRREVWLRIASHLNLTQEALWQLFDGAIIVPDKEN